MEDNVHMLLEGTVAEMIVKLEPTTYKKHMWYNKHGKAMLYVQLKSPIWDTTSGSVILEIAVRVTTGIGIYTKPYDKCVANKNIEGKQCSIIWQLDNLKISHRKKEEVEDIL